MISRALNIDNDLCLRNGSIATVTDAEQVAQHVRTRLLFYLGEWFLDLLKGLPYLQQIFVKPANLPLVESLLKAEIARTPEVNRLISYEMEFNKSTRVLRVAFSAETIHGVISSNLFLNQTCAQISVG